MQQCYVTFDSKRKLSAISIYSPQIPDFRFKGSGLDAIEKPQEKKSSNLRGMNYTQVICII